MWARVGPTSSSTSRRTLSSSRLLFLVLARYCYRNVVRPSVRLSVCPSIRPSVTLMYAEQPDVRLTSRMLVRYTRCASTLNTAACVPHTAKNCSKLMEEIKITLVTNFQMAINRFLALTAH